MPLRDRIAAHLPLLVFLGFYALTAVLANFLYATPLGAEWPALSIANFDANKTFGELGWPFWALMLMPLALTPAIALFTKRAAQPIATQASSWFPEFSKPVYLLISAILYAYAIFSLVHADAFGRLVAGADAVAAVNARFSLLSDLGGWPQVVMQSLLVFLAVYAVVRAARERSWFWSAFAGWHAVALTFLLLLLNMKWPAVVFLVTLGLCVFTVAKHHPFLKAAAVMATGGLVFLAISVVLLRMVPVDQPRAITVAAENPVKAQPSPPRKVTMSAEYATDAAQTGAARTPELIISSLNRMAVSVPFYYRFADIHADCAQGLRRMWPARPLECEPTLVVYTKMFGKDGFEGRGTAPAAVHLYAYALSGWPGAIIALSAASVLIGLFLTLWQPAKSNAIFAAAFVMGGYTAYFLSQLPIEGPIIYDHGMIWWSLLVLGYAAFWWSVVAIKSSSPSWSRRRAA